MVSVFGLILKIGINDNYMTTQMDRDNKHLMSELKMLEMHKSDADKKLGQAEMKVADLTKKLAEGGGGGNAAELQTIDHLVIFFLLKNLERHKREACFRVNVFAGPNS